MQMSLEGRVIDQAGQDAGALLPMTSLSSVRLEAKSSTYNEMVNIWAGFLESGELKKTLKLNYSRQCTNHNYTDQ